MRQQTVSPFHRSQFSPLVFIPLWLLIVIFENFWLIFKKNLPFYVILRGLLLVGSKISALVKSWNEQLIYMPNHWFDQIQTFNPDSQIFRLLKFLQTFRIQNWLTKDMNISLFTCVSIGNPRKNMKMIRRVVNFWRLGLK